MFGSVSLRDLISTPKLITLDNCPLTQRSLYKLYFITSLCLYHLEEYSLRTSDYFTLFLIHLEPLCDGLGLLDLRPVGMDVKLVKTHHWQLIPDCLKQIKMVKPGFILGWFRVLVCLKLSLKDIMVAKN